jgi:hypothetical protein
VLKLSGTIGEFGGIPTIVTSLTLVTSAGRYGPYGREEGTAFTTRMVLIHDSLIMTVSKTVVTYKFYDSAMTV